MKILFRIKYPKLLLLLLTVVLAYIIFKERNVLPFHNTLLMLGYDGIFLAGIFFTYGFTAAPATAVLLIMARELNLFWAGVIGGAGALIGDLLIFSFIRDSFMDEIKKLSKEKIIMRMYNNMHSTLKKYLILVLGGFIISSPLPDEIGVSLLAISTKISTKEFMIVSYLLNTVGIFVILLIGKMI